MEQSEASETNKMEQSRPSLGEEMSKLLASMDPQGFLNEPDQDDSQLNGGIDQTKIGDAHAAAHKVSLMDPVKNLRKWKPTLPTIALWILNPGRTSSCSSH